jgi:hypothetical protein
MSLVQSSTVMGLDAETNPAIFRDSPSKKDASVLLATSVENTFVSRLKKYI